MKRFVCFEIVFLSIFSVLFIAATDNLFSHIPYKSAQWKSKTTVQGNAESMIIEQKVFYKNGKMRTEAEIKNPVSGEKQNTVTIVDDKFIYSYDKNKKQGTKMSINSEGPMNPEKQNIEMLKCRKNAIKKGNEKVNDIQCIIYEYNCMINNVNFSIIEWRNKDGFPVKTVSKYQNMITTVETFDLKTNVTLSDLLFKPETDIKFMDMEKMMGEMKGLKNKSDVQNKKNKIEAVQEKNNDNTNSSEDDVDAGEMMQNMMKKYMNK